MNVLHLFFHYRWLCLVGLCLVVFTAQPGWAASPKPPSSRKVLEQVLAKIPSLRKAKITPLPDLDWLTDLSISPDGKRVGFETISEMTGNNEINYIGHGGPVYDLTTRESYYPAPPDGGSTEDFHFSYALWDPWQPEYQYLHCCREFGPMQVWRIRYDGKNPQLISRTNEETHVTPLTQSRQLLVFVYSTEEEERRTIGGHYYLQSVDDPTQRKEITGQEIIKVTPDRNLSPDGRYRYGDEPLFTSKDMNAIQKYVYPSNASRAYYVEEVASKTRTHLFLDSHFLSWGSKSTESISVTDMSWLPDSSGMVCNVSAHSSGGYSVTKSELWYFGLNGEIQPLGGNVRILYQTTDLKYWIVLLNGDLFKLAMN